MADPVSFAEQRPVIYILEYHLEPAIGRRYFVLHTDGTTRWLPPHRIAQFNQLAPMADGPMDSEETKAHKARLRHQWMLCRHPTYSLKRPHPNNDAEDESCSEPSPHDPLSARHYSFASIRSWRYARNFQGRLYQIEWSDGSLTWEPSSVLSTIRGVDIVYLLSMAQSPTDDTPTAAEKAKKRAKHAAIVID